MHNYYTILGIADFSGAEEIKAAHRRLSKRYHPDLNNGNKLYEERFREIQHAYEQLRDPVTKERYDNRLRYFYAPKSTYTAAPEPEPVVVLPETPVIKWRRSRGAVIACLILVPLFARVLFSEPWERDTAYSPELLVTPPTFTLGSEREVVFRAQGKPLSIIREGSGEMWAYGKSLVVFKDGIVTHYFNIDSNLHIRAVSLYE